MTNLGTIEVSSLKSQSVREFEPTISVADSDDFQYVGVPVTKVDWLIEQLTECRKALPAALRQEAHKYEQASRPDESFTNKAWRAKTVKKLRDLATQLD